MSNDRRLKDRVAVITGAAQGIGLGIAERLAAEGAIAILADIKAEAATAPPQSAWLTRAMWPRPCPSTSATMPPSQELAAAVGRKYGRCEILVNNAAIGADTHIETMTMEEYHRIVGINQDGAVRMAMAFVPLLKKGGDGRRIVNVASIQGLRGWPNQLAYATAKGAIVNFTRALACELAPYDIMVNAIAPGLRRYAHVDSPRRIARIRLGLVPRHLCQVRSHPAAALRQAGRHGRSDLLSLLGRRPLCYRSDPERRWRRICNILRTGHGTRETSHSVDRRSTTSGRQSKGRLVGRDPARRFRTCPDRRAYGGRHHGLWQRLYQWRIGRSGAQGA